MDLFRAILQTQEQVAYIAAGSAIGMMQAIFYDPASPRQQRVDEVDDSLLFDC